VRSTNAQYSVSIPGTKAGSEDRTSWIFSEEYLGLALDGPRQRWCEWSWQRAMQFCGLAYPTDRSARYLPTEASGSMRAVPEARHRCGTAAQTADFSHVANMADYTSGNLAYEGWRPKSPGPDAARGTLQRWKTGHATSAATALTHGASTICTGTPANGRRTSYRPTAYRERMAVTRANAEEKKVVRGGFWYDRPACCRSSFRLSYPAWHESTRRVPVVCELPTSGSPWARNEIEMGIRGSVGMLANLHMQCAGSHSGCLECMYDPASWNPEGFQVGFTAPYSVDSEGARTFWKLAQGCSTELARWNTPDRYRQRLALLALHRARLGGSTSGSDCQTASHETSRFVTSLSPKSWEGNGESMVDS